MPTLQNQIQAMRRPERRQNLVQAMEDLRNVDSLMGLLGFAVKITPERTGMQLELQKDNERLGSIRIEMEEGHARISRPTVNRDFAHCGIENGLRAAAIRLLYGYPVETVDFRP